MVAAAAKSWMFLWSVPMLMSKVCGSESKVSDVVGTGMFAVCRDVETGSDYRVCHQPSRALICALYVPYISEFR